MLDTSQLCDYQFCPRWYQYRYILGLEFPVGFAEGSFSKFLVHDPITRWYQSGGVWVPDWDQQWSEYVAVVKIPPLYLPSSLAKSMFEKYVEQLGRPTLEKYRVMCVEKMLPTTIEGFGVKPDVVLVKLEDRTPWPLDIKTSKYEQFTPAFDRQFVAQVDATRAEGFIKDFYQIGGKGDWVREEKRVPRDYVDEWRDETALSLKQMSISMETQIYPKHSRRSCQMGRVLCPALEICEAGKLRGEVVKRWPKVENPLKYQED